MSNSSANLQKVSHRREARGFLWIVTIVRGFQLGGGGGDPHQAQFSLIDGGGYSTYYSCIFHNSYIHSTDGGTKSSKHDEDLMEGLS
ncbi:hypothetical protein CY35_04G047800 [Sphagnum magellanicum]|nr:hypothetical protein CY35_04G047800 [Sphagnum magellanicum]